MRGAIWQPGMYDNAARGANDFDAMAEYNARNPVTAGLVEESKEWPYTWVWWWDGE